MELFSKLVTQELTLTMTHFYNPIRFEMTPFQAHLKMQSPIKNERC